METEKKSLSECSWVVTSQWNYRTRREKITVLSSVSSFSITIKSGLLGLAWESITAVVPVCRSTITHYSIIQTLLLCTTPFIYLGRVGSGNYRQLAFVISRYQICDDDDIPGQWDSVGHLETICYDNKNSDPVFSRR